VSARGFDVCDRLLALVAKEGADAVVLVRESESGHVRFAASEITTAGEVSTTDARLTLAFGRRHATALTNQVDEASFRALVSRAVALAKVAPDDPEYLPPLAPQRYMQAPAAWDEGTRGLAASVRASAARAAIARADEKSLVCAGFVQSHADALTLATTTGLRAEHRSTWAQMTTTARTSDGTGSGWAGSEATRAADIDPNALALTASEKAEQSRGASKLGPGKYTVVLEPAAVADLLGFLIEALDARAADQGRSFFSHGDGHNRIGETMFDARVTLRSDPLDPATPGRPWDDDGTPLRATTWIADGKLENLQHTRFWAHKTGRAPTGAHGTFQLSSPSSQVTSAPALVEGVHRGLLVTRFWYTRWLDPRQLLVTGLTRDGVWLIEDGRVTRPVNNFRFNESPMKMLTRLVAMTSRTVRVPAGGDAMRVPSLCCDDFEMASVSDAI
jgi:predicted Zn-dependent protease